MNAVEYLLAAAFAVLAIRSAWYWHRHRLEGRDGTDDLLFALFVTGRVGTWLVAAAMFTLFGSIDAQGRAYTDEARQYTWLVVVFLGLGAMQLLAAWFLGARRPSRRP